MDAQINCLVTVIDIIRWDIHYIGRVKKVEQLSTGDTFTTWKTEPKIETNDFRVKFTYYVNYYENYELQ